MSIRSVLLASATTLLFSLPSVSAAPTYANGSFPFQRLAAANYHLVDNYNPSNFYSTFNFFQGGDPTHGFVDYQSQGNAQSQGLVNTNNNQIYMGVDYKTVNPSAGRKSVRVTSNKAYTHGLFIADIAHMPGAACGVWPAFWMFGPNWPGSGEIDIIEGVSRQSTNIMTLHTSPGCVMNNAGSLAGLTTLDANCNANNGYNGCGTQSNRANTYGDGFNAAGGGVYATQWESSGIYIWFFPRNAIPADIKSGNPVTGNWGLPLAAFNGGSGCNVDDHFKNHNLVFDTTFCGDWAGSVWGNDGSCSSRASTCQNFVAANPGEFANSYWSVNSVKVYQM